jgi:hypothetical protein
MNKIWHLSHPKLCGVACLHVSSLVCPDDCLLTCLMVCAVMRMRVFSPFSACSLFTSMICTNAAFFIQLGTFVSSVSQLVTHDHGNFW